MSPSVEPFNEAKYKALMDGLECSEIYFSETQENKDFRIDSDFHTSTIFKSPYLEYLPIKDFLIQSQYGLSMSMNEDGNGYPIYRMNEIHNMLCDLEVSKYAEISPDILNKFKLNSGDVLFNRTNSYEWVGRTGIYYAGDESRVFASYLVRFVTDPKKVLPEYFATYLNTKYGVRDIKRRSRQSINQTNVNPEEVKEIEIPLLNSDIQSLIQKCFHDAYWVLLHAEEVYKHAQLVLMEYLSIDQNIISCNNITVKNVRDSFCTSGRLDAEYYQPKYDDYERALHTSDSVQSLCNLYDKNFLPKDENEYPYIELANVGTMGEISDVEVIGGKDLPTRARRRVKKGQIIVASVEGSLRSCALITDEFDGALCSTGFYVLDSDSINPETLLVLFKSEPIQALMKQRCSGTILTAISKDELLGMPLPQIDTEIQKEISQKVQESFALRHKSEHLLEYAKQAVEMAIEQGEDVAMKWLESKVSE